MSSQRPYDKNKKDNFDGISNDFVLRLHGDRLVEAGIIALKKQPINRSAQDQGVLLRQIDEKEEKHCIPLYFRLTQEIEFFKDHFKDHHSEMLSSFSENFGYCHKKGKESVFKQGDLGDKFYLILKGKVSISMKIKRQVFHIQPQQNKKSKGDEHQQNLIEFEEEEDVEVKQLTVGQTFGELALIEDKPRAATIICLEDSNFITFDKASFASVLQEKETYKLKEEIRQFSGNYLLRDFSLNLLKNLYLLGTVAEYQRGEQLFKEGEISEQFFVILKGDFKVTKKLKYYQDELKINKLNNNERASRVIDLDIGLLTTPSTLGEEEFFKGVAREVGVVCESQEGKVMVIKRNDFLRKLGYDPNSLKIMQSRAHQKYGQRKKKLEELREKYEKNEDELNLHVFQLSNKNNKKHLSQKSNLPLQEEVEETQFLNPLALINNRFCEDDDTIRANITPLNKSISTPSEREREKGANKKTEISPKQNSKKSNNLFIPFLLFEDQLKQENKKKNSKISSLLRDDTPFTNKSENAKKSTLQKENYLLNENRKQLSISSPNSVPASKCLRLRILEKLKDIKVVERKENFGQVATQVMQLHQKSIHSRQKNKSHTVTLSSTQESSPSPSSSISQKYSIFQSNKHKIAKSSYCIPLKSTELTSQIQTSRYSNRNDLGLKENLATEGCQINSSTSVYEFDEPIEQISSDTLSESEINNLSKNPSIQKQSLKFQHNNNNSNQSIDRSPSIMYSQSSNSPFSRLDSFGNNLQRQSSSRSSIKVQTKTRGSILSDKCRDFILNNGTEQILAIAKKKSILKNRYLYLEEYPYEKSISTNLKDQDIDKLIKQKIISSVINSGQESHRPSFSMVSSSPMSPSYDGLTFQQMAESKRESIHMKEENNTVIKLQSIHQINNGSKDEDFFNNNNNNNDYSNCSPSNYRYSKFSDEKKTQTENFPHLLDIESQNNYFQTAQQLDKNAEKQNNSRNTGTPSTNREDYQINCQKKKRTHMISRPSFKGLLPLSSRDSKTEQQSWKFEKEKKDLQSQSLTLSQLFKQLPQTSSSNQQCKGKSANQNNKINHEKPLKGKKMSCKRPHSSISKVFKHIFKSEPCHIENEQIYHIYQCGNKNDGKCQCSNNHLNILPLKFRSELIFRYSTARKKNNFSFFNHHQNEDTKKQQ